VRDGGLLSFLNFEGHRLWVWPATAPGLAGKAAIFLFRRGFLHAKPRQHNPEANMLDFTSSFDGQEPIEEPVAEAAGAREAAPPKADRELLDAYSHAVISVADAVGPAVLRVETRGNGPQGGGVGSGVTIAPDGLVLTNCHVVEGAREISLRDSEGRVMEARSLGIICCRVDMLAAIDFDRQLCRATCQVENIASNHQLSREPGPILR